ncbi:hypothetical protein NSK_001677 [Nannochloropsis salina CCMP1776]|uniref:COP9 signalosome complex subunit 3 n=1 Tax=Nannochloropsis salina CCMP1776 TaxID=1027361 RepID=A0A4D9DCT8_9STRA|nr:hypothetical protein NSK_001677 [Nannochloropsis salina CCMP1776]|eukprot:TFJ87345.1 hypothetical protein NSK_001677 [Nannochloropsis salina CCMP1776]
MAVLDDVLNHILNLSTGREEDYDELHRKLSDQAENLRSLSTTTATGHEEPPPLLRVSRDTLHLPEHTLGVLHLLTAQAPTVSVHHASSHREHFLGVCEVFLVKFDPDQAARAVKEFAELVHRYTDLLGHSPPSDAGPGGAGGGEEADDSSMGHGNLGEEAEVAAETAHQPAQEDAAPAPTRPLPAVKDLVRGLLPLETAARTLVTDPHCLTPVHPDLLQVCLGAGRLQQAVDFVRERPIYRVDPAATGVVALDVLRYFYYAGMAFLSLQHLHDAVDCFKAVISTPAQALSAVAVEAYRKLVLAHALLPTPAKPLPASPSPSSSPSSSGPSASSTIAAAQTRALLPPKTSPIVARSIRQHALPYHDILTAAQAEDAERVRGLLSQHADTLTAHQNMGLAQQILDQIPVRKLRQLARTFVALSLQDVAEHTGSATPAAAEHMVLDQVAKGGVSATIDDVAQMVYFDDDRMDNQIGSTASIVRLDEELKLVMNLADRVKAFDLRISSAPEYMSKAWKGGGRAGLGRGGGRGGLGLRSASTVVAGGDGGRRGAEQSRGGGGKGRE